MKKDQSFAQTMHLQQNGDDLARKFVASCFLVWITFLLPCIDSAENVHMSKVFILPIEPGMFNWTLQGKRDQFSYRPTLLNAPDLPPWINYVYSTRHQTGFLYGVPPQLPKSSGIELEIIGLNRDSYETRRRVVPMHIEEKPDPARFEVQLKIFNLNVEDLFDTHRLSRLLDVFRSRLWPSSRDDLHVTMLASAVQLGARLPLRPSEGEGVVVRLGSGADFSTDLRVLQEEVKPLLKISSCPRDFKRTSVERLFREQGFALDWCTFRLLEAEEVHLKATAESSPPPVPPKSRTPSYRGDEEKWHAPPARSDVPQRSYAHEFVVTILVPMLVLLLLVMLLSLILCFHHEGMEDYGSDEYFDSIFNICEDYWRSKRNKDVPEVQMVQYAAVHRATDTVRSVSVRRAPSHMSTPERATSSVLGGNSLASRSLTGSPNSSLPRSTSPRPASDNSCYMRPNPPPYTGPFNNRLDGASSSYTRSDF